MQYRLLFIWIAAAFALPMLLACGRQMEVSAMRESMISAAERGHVAIVEELLAHSDVDVNHINNLGWTALLEAIVLSDGGPKHQQIVQLLIDHGADVNIADKEGETPLQHARRRGYTLITEKLLRAGAR